MGNLVSQITDNGEPPHRTRGADALIWTPVAEVRAHQHASKLQTPSPVQLALPPAAQATSQLPLPQSTAQVEPSHSTTQPPPAQSILQSAP